MNSHPCEGDAVADLSDKFVWMIGNRTYPEFDQFKNDLLNFQRATNTSYEISWTRTAGQWLRQTGKQIPVKYKYVKYVCIHAPKRKEAKKFRRFVV